MTRGLEGTLRQTCLNLECQGDPIFRPSFSVSSNSTLNQYNAYYYYLEAPNTARVPASGCDGTLQAVRVELLCPYLQIHPEQPSPSALQFPKMKPSPFCTAHSSSQLTALGKTAVVLRTIWQSLWAMMYHMLLDGWGPSAFAR